MRIVITGDGEIAYQLAQALHQQHDVVIIENDPRETDRFGSLDVQLLRGDATHPEVLREAGVTSSDSFISCRASDELNIIACLTAKRIGCAHTTCFVSKEDYVRSFAGIPEGDDALAIDRIIWPQYMLAEEITRIVLVPRAIDVEIFAGGRIWLMEFKLREDSPLIGPLLHLELPLGVLAVAVRKGEELSIPSGKTQLEAGDRVAFMGNRGGLRQLQERFIRGSAGAPEPRDRDVVIVGGGTVGLTLAKRLEREKDIRLKIVERDRARCQHLAAELPRALVLRGDGHRPGAARGRTGRPSKRAGIGHQQRPKQSAVLIAGQPDAGAEDHHAGQPQAEHPALRARRHRRASQPDGYGDQRRAELPPRDRRAAAR